MASSVLSEQAVTDASGQAFRLLNTSVVFLAMLLSLWGRAEMLPER